MIDEAYLKPVMDAYTGSIADADFTGVINAGDAFLDYKTNVEQGTAGKGKFFGRRAKRKGFLNPLLFKQAYDQQMQTMAPSIGKKLIDYALENKHSDIAMRKFVEERRLGSFIRNNIPIDPNDPNSARLHMWATPQKDLLTQTKEWGEWATTGWTPGGVLTTGAAVGTAGVLAKKYGKDFLKGSTQSVKVDPWNLTKSKDILRHWQGKYKSNLKSQGGPGIKGTDMKNLKTNISKLQKHITSKGDILSQKNIPKHLRQSFTTPKTWLGSLGRMVKGVGVYAGIPFATEKVGTLIAGEKAGELTGQTVRTALSATTLALQKIVKNKGKRWLLTQMAKKGGVGLGLRLAAKLGIGAITGVPSGGAMTAAMTVLAVKDFYDLAKMIKEISQSA